MTKNEQTRQEQEPIIQTERSSISFIETSRFYNKYGIETYPPFSKVKESTMKSILALEDNYNLSGGRIIVVPSITACSNEKIRIHPHLYLFNKEGDIKLTSKTDWNSKDINSLWAVSEAGPNWISLWEPANIREKLSDGVTIPWGLTLDFLACKDYDKINTKVLLDRSLTYFLNYAQHIHAGDSPTISARVNDNNMDATKSDEFLPRLYDFSNGKIELKTGQGTAIDIHYDNKPVSINQLKKYGLKDKLK